MRSGMKHLAVLIMAAVFMLSLAGSALAENYPSGPVTVMIPYKAGGSTDAMGRVLAKALRKELKQPIVVQNRTGGGGTVAATFLKNSAPDGYTLLLGASEIPIWNPLVQNTSFSRKDFKYIAAITAYQNGLICSKDKPYKTLEEMVAYSKKHPGLKVAYQSPLDKAILESIMKKEGLDWALVSTTGGGEVMQLIFGDKIDASYSGGFHNQYLQKLEVLASFNADRLAASPDKPSVKELGYPLCMPGYVTFMVHKDVPDAIVKKLETAIMNATKDKNFQTIVKERMRAPVLNMGSEKLSAFMIENEKAFNKAAK